jgi:hypothetical protein
MNQHCKIGRETSHSDIAFILKIADNSKINSEYENIYQVIGKSIVKLKGVIKVIAEIF